GRLDMVLPDGRTLRFEGPEPGPHGEMIIHDTRFWRRCAHRGEIGFAEAFMAGAFDTPNLADVLAFFVTNFEAAGRFAAGDAVARFFDNLRHRLLRSNTRKGSKKNILAHYDLGNDFYSRWLDRTMTYSSAIFSSPEESLEDAQLAKYRAIARD